MSINCKNGLGHSWKKSLLSGNALVVMMMMATIMMIMTTIMMLSMVIEKYIDFEDLEAMTISYLLRKPFFIIWKHEA